MKTKWYSVCAMSLLVGLSGCASMSGDECMTSDWSAIGYEDGARGYTTAQFSQRRKACAKHGVTPDFTAYQNGRSQGLIEYCQPGRGFDVGSNGGRYNGVCDADRESGFLDAYNAGYHLYTLRSNVNRATSAINSKQYELERLEDEIRQNEVSLISDDVTIEQRILLLADLKDQSERTGQLEAEIEDLYQQRERHRVELENYQVAVADYSY